MGSGLCRPGAQSPVDKAGPVNGEPQPGPHPPVWLGPLWSPWMLLAPHLCPSFYLTMVSGHGS